jgi:hypothetical protein
MPDEGEAGGGGALEGRGGVCLFEDPATVSSADILAFGLTTKEAHLLQRSFISP